MESSSLTDRIQSSFERQELMRTLGARLDFVSDGEVRIRLPQSQHISQQHGFAHAGAITSIADSACGYACLTRMGERDAVLSVEFKINLMAPAAGDSFIAIGRVVRAGRTISVANAEVISESSDGSTKTIALMQATMMRIEGNEKLQG